MQSIPIGRWFRRETIKQIGRDKCGLLVTADESLLAKFTPYWADFVPFVRRLISTCFPDLRDVKNKLTHDNVTKILEDAYNAIEEPLEPSTTSSREAKRRKIQPLEGDGK